MRLTGYPSIPGVTQGQQAQFYEGRNPAGFSVPPDFLTGPMNSLEIASFFILRLFQPLVKEMKQRYHFGAEPWRDCSLYKAPPTSAAVTQQQKPRGQWSRQQPGKHYQTGQVLNRDLLAVRHQPAIIRP